MPPKKTPQILTINTPFNSNGRTPHDVIKSNAELDQQILKPWPHPYNSADVRKLFMIIDHPAFGYHKWFRDFFALPEKQRTDQMFIKSIENYIKYRNLFLFEKRKDFIQLKGTLSPLTEWCKTQRNNNFALETVSDIVEFFRWKTRDGNMRKDTKQPVQSESTFVRKHVKFCYKFMVIQGWYKYTSETGKANDPVAFASDPEYAHFRDVLHERKNQEIRDRNKPIGEARIVTKALSDEKVQAFVELFNVLKEFHDGTNQGILSAILQFAVMSFNFNLGLRSGIARNTCFSWIKYHEDPGTCGGIYLNIGNPEGTKAKKLSEFGFAQYIVRHKDVRQCTIGSLIKIIVAWHDIKRDTSLLDEVEECIKEREDYVNAKSKNPNMPKKSPTPQWHDYRILRSPDNPYKYIHKSSYADTIKAAYNQIDAKDMLAITHEPHNRVPNVMMRMGLPNDQIAVFNAWKTGNENEFTNLYINAGVDVISALARAGHQPHGDDKVYNCPRDGLDEDFEMFDDIRQRVLGGRVPDLYRRAVEVNKFLDDSERITTTVIFLELLNKFLIRVWLEDAAILYYQYPDSVCYKNHPVFRYKNGEKWQELALHLEKLRKIRGEIQPVSLLDRPRPVLASASPSNEDIKKFKRLMDTQHNLPTIQSLYDWRKHIKEMWQVVKSSFPKSASNRGIPKNVWKEAKAYRNFNLYSRLKRICEYINHSANLTGRPVEDIITDLQQTADDLGYGAELTRDFAETQFRIITSLGEKSKEWGKVKINRTDFNEAFRNNHIPPAPYPVPDEPLHVE